MIAKSQDVLVALKLAVAGFGSSYARFASELNMSASEVHSCIRRLVIARLLDPETKLVRREVLRAFLVHGVPYVFPASPKELTRGTPTAWAAPTWPKKLPSSDLLPPVWPDPNGSVMGAAVEPLYWTVPRAARSDAKLYDLLALVDAVRIGRARERSLAEKEISQRLKSDAAA